MSLMLAGNIRRRPTQKHVRCPKRDCKRLCCVMDKEANEHVRRFKAKLCWCIKPVVAGEAGGCREFESGGYGAHGQHGGEPEQAHGKYKVEAWLGKAAAGHVTGDLYMHNFEYLRTIRL